MSAKKAFTVLMLMVLCLLPIKDTIAAPIVDSSFAQDGPPVTEISTGIAPTTFNRSGIGSLSGSNVMFNPTAGGDVCYDSGTPQTFCFQSESFTNDYEYVYNNWLKFPADWTVSDVYVQGTPSCDVGSWGEFSWGFHTSPYEVNINHPRYQQTVDHCLATYCVDVTPAGTNNTADISWYFDGDGYGSLPHNPCSSDGYTPTGQTTCDEMINPVASVPICELVSQVVLTPSEIETSGCHAESQTHTLNILNSTGATATFDILYNKDFPGDFWGPDQITLDDGASADFDVILDPHLCAEDADYLATVSVSDGVYSDETTIYYEVYSELQEWQQIPTDPNLLMDNVLAGYAGKVWSITGYGASNGVTTYDPALDTWTGIPGSITPWGVSSYPRSGCQVGNEVFIYGDAGGAYTGLWSYNMDTNTWTSETPGGTPPPYAGIWAPSWVADTSSGVCYMTGGGTAPGGGNLTTVYVYDTVANAWLPELPVFTTARDFHAAFLYTRPTDSHNLLCVAGGVNIASVVFDSTQCYDFSTAAWDPENADLGALPNACWGMGYAQREGELWLVEGADAAFALYNQSAYYDIEDGEWVMAGPLPSGNVYRTAAVTLDNTVYHIGGSTGGFTPSGLSDKFVDITCPACEIPGFTKEATELAFPGQTIHYSISVDPFVKDTALVYDYLPDSVEYVPGSLSVSPDVGTYDYDSLDRMIWWYNGPGLLKGKGWTPAAKSSISSTTAITTHYDAPAKVTSSTPTDYAIEMVLWDQPLSTVNQNAYVNQEFSDFASYSSFLADDFTVTMPWMVNSIFVPGDGWNGFTTLLNASALNFMIYEDSAGIPAGDPTGGGAMPVWALSLLPTDPQVTISAGTSGYDSNVQLDLDEPLMLPTGHYWLIFYPSLSFASGGQFGRQPADTANLHTASFINPGGGFGLGPFWQPWNVLDVTQTDLAFRIEGEQVGSLLIEFDATASGLNQVIWNFAYLAYGSYLTQAGADTFTGNGIYLPMTIK